MLDEYNFFSLFLVCLQINTENATGILITLNEIRCFMTILDGGGLSFAIFRKLYGDQAVYFDKELKPRIKHTTVGLVSMVNNGSDMHGSQVLLTLMTYYRNINNIDYRRVKYKMCVLYVLKLTKSAKRHIQQVLSTLNNGIVELWNWLNIAISFYYFFEVDLYILD